MSKARSKETVDELLAKAGHPLVNEVQAVRGLIKGVDSGIEEEWKWNAPSFSYGGNYLVTFNLWERERIRLVFHNAEVVNIDSSLLEGDYPTRRMAYFADMADIEAKRPELMRVIRALLRLNGKR
ncbi:MAG TPA: DUF1801 domain-containing protein [Chloroflexia bacterium]|nr:DUF1801 domain-containing protein [Chloroflexia bacterium]